MRDCVLTMYGSPGHVLGEAKVVLPPLAERTVLDRLHREHIEPRKAQFAVAREGRKVRALFLTEAKVPMASVRLPTARKKPFGRWVTSAVPLGDIGRAFAGPDVFFRQIDLDAGEAWLATVLVGFGVDVDVSTRAFGDDALFDWDLRGEHFYYRGKGRRWQLHGGGNTSQDRLDEAVAVAAPTSAADVFWAVGAVRLR